MTPKEKAEEIVKKYSNIEIAIGDKYDGYLRMDISEAKECALIAVDEIIKEKEECHKYECGGNELKHWQEVKTEIENL